MIRRALLVLLALAAFGPGAQAAELEALIEQNQQVLKKKVRDLEEFSRQKAFLPAARLWVHKRGPAQDRLVTEIEERAKALELTGGPIDFKPVQEVDVGPSRSQLRFFKAADRDRAHRLAESLEGLVPDLTVSDFSSQYGDVGWIKPGHLELWLAADLP